jgi:hypothetical protein
MQQIQTPIFKSIRPKPARSLGFGFKLAVRFLAMVRAVGAMTLVFAMCAFLWALLLGLHTIPSI